MEPHQNPAEICGVFDVVHPYYLAFSSYQCGDDLVVISDAYRAMNSIMLTRDSLARII